MKGELPDQNTKKDKKKKSSHGCLIIVGILVALGFLFWGIGSGFSCRSELSEAGEKRAAYAEALEQNLLETGMDISITTLVDDDATSLFIETPSASNQMVYRLKQNPNFFPVLKELGFKHVHLCTPEEEKWFGQGGPREWYWDLK